jgi:hypothetical protein
MAAFKTLLDNECGTTNPLIKLSQFYTHDKTLVTRVMKNFSAKIKLIHLYC